MSVVFFLNVTIRTPQVVLFKTTRFYNKTRLQRRHKSRACAKMTKCCKTEWWRAFARSLAYKNVTFFVSISTHCAPEESLKGFLSKNVTVINLLMRLLMTMCPANTFAFLKVSDNNWFKRKKAIENLHGADPPRTGSVS